MGTFDVNYVTRNDSYVQSLATLRVFQPLFERVMKPAVVRDFGGAKMSFVMTGIRVPFLPCNAWKLG